MCLNWRFRVPPLRPGAAQSKKCILVYLELNNFGPPAPLSWNPPRGGGLPCNSTTVRGSSLFLLPPTPRTPIPGQCSRSSQRRPASVCAESGCALSLPHSKSSRAHKPPERHAWSPPAAASLASLSCLAPAAWPAWATLPTARSLLFRVSTPLFHVVEAFFPRTPWFKKKKGPPRTLWSPQPAWFFS